MTTVETFTAPKSLGITTPIIGNKQIFMALSQAFGCVVDWEKNDWVNEEDDDENIS